MSKTKILNDIKTLLGMQVKLEAMKLDDGITVVEAEAFEPNQEIFIVNAEDRVALPVGEYTLEDKRIIIVVEEGIIAEIKEAGEPEPEGEAPVEEEMEAEATPTQPKKIVESISKELFFAEIEKLRGEIAELKEPKVELKKVEEVVVELAEEVKPIIASPETKVEKKQVVLHSEKKNLTAQERVFNRIANLKKNK